MKHVLTLLVACTIVTAAGAQTHAQQNEAKHAMIGDKKDGSLRTTDESRTVVLGNKPGRHSHTATAREYSANKQGIHKHPRHHKKGKKHSGKMGHHHKSNGNTYKGS